MVLFSRVPSSMELQSFLVLWSINQLPVYNNPLFYCNTNDIYHIPTDVLRAMDIYFTVHWLSYPANYVRNKKLVGVLVGFTPELDPKTRIRVLTVNLGGNPRKCCLRIGDRRQGKERSQQKVCLFVGKWGSNPSVEL